MATDPNEVGNRFKFHTSPSAERTFAHNQVRERCRRLAIAFADSLPEGREKALALTKIEEAMFWANAGIARSSELPAAKSVEDEPVKTTEDHARDAYMAYGAATGFKNFRGDPMPPWENLGVVIQSAWVAAADRLHSNITQTLRKDNA